MRIKTVTTKAPDAKFHLTEMEASNAPVKDINWHGQDIETPTTRLDDPGTGSAVIIKCFDFSFPPVNTLEKVPTKAQLIQYHRMHINPYLWKDGLELREDIKPLKLIINKRNNTFRIYATCAYKKGFLVPRHIQDQLKPVQNIVSRKN